MTHTLYYVHDPMCSWCWGFRPAWQALRATLPREVNVRFVLGGLAADTEQPMPAPLQARIRATWQQIQRDIPGTRFNYRFWVDCRPRRATYAACRAVIAAAHQAENAADRMLLAIQKAYYLQARNPSDDAVLISLAGEIGLPPGAFAADLNSARTQAALYSEFALRDRLGVHSFPGLVLEHGKRLIPIAVDYTQPAHMLERIRAELDGNPP